MNLPAISSVTWNVQYFHTFTTLYLFLYPTSIQYHPLTNVLKEKKNHLCTQTGFGLNMHQPEKKQIQFSITSGSEHEILSLQCHSANLAFSGWASGKNLLGEKGAVAAVGTGRVRLRGHRKTTTRQFSLTNLFPRNLRGTLVIKNSHPKESRRNMLLLLCSGAREHARSQCHFSHSLPDYAQKRLLPYPQAQL